MYNAGMKLAVVLFVCACGQDAGKPPVEHREPPAPPPVVVAAPIVPDAAVPDAMSIEDERKQAKAMADLLTGEPPPSDLEERRRPGVDLDRQVIDRPERKVEVGGGSRGRGPDTGKGVGPKGP